MSDCVPGNAITTKGQGFLREAKKVSQHIICNPYVLNIDALLQNGYIISAPDYNEHGKEISDRTRAEWEMERYTRAGIPAHDLKILMRVKYNAKNLDAGHRIGPLKFGKASLIGLLPVIGDFTDVLLAYWDIYLPARKVSKGDDMTAFKSRMKFRIVALGCVGSIPMLGNLAVTIVRWNMRNAAALEEMLLKRAGYI